MAKSSSRKKAICKVGDRILAPGNKWGTVSSIASKGLYPYKITWDNGHSENYSAANFEKYQYQVCPPDPAAEDIQEEDEAQLDLDFSRGQEWKVGDQCLAWYKCGDIKEWRPAKIERTDKDGVYITFKANRIDRKGDFTTVTASGWRPYKDIKPLTDSDFSREQEWKVGDRATDSILGEVEILASNEGMVKVKTSCGCDPWLSPEGTKALQPSNYDSLPEHRFYIEADGQVWNGNRFTTCNFEAKTYNSKGIKAAVYQLRLNPLVKELKRRGITLEIKERFKCSDNLTSAQESESVSHLQDCSSEDLPLLAYASEMNTAGVSSQSDTPACQSTQISKPELVMVGKDVQVNLTSLQPHHHVNRSQFKENDSEPTTQEIVSQQLSERSPASSQDSSQLRTCEAYSVALTDLDLECDISPESSPSFPSAGTMSNGKWYEVASIAAPLLESDYYWLDSPTALSSASSRAPGQSKLERSLRTTGRLQDGECINPIFLEDSFEIPLGWSDPSELKTAAQLLAAEEKPLAMRSILAWQQSPYEESSTSTHSLKTEEELTPVDDSAVGKHFWCDRLTVAVEVLTVHNWRETSKSPKIIKGARCKPWWNKDEWGNNFPDAMVLPLADLEEIEKFSSEIPEILLSGIRKKSLEKSETHASKQIGSLYHDTEWRTNKSGEKIQYPRVDGERDPENDDHWYWYISYVVRDGNHKKNARKYGGWKDTTAYVPRKNLSLCRELMREEFPVELTIEVCQIKWLWSQRRGEYLIGESKPEACPRLVIVDFASKQLFISGSDWGNQPTAKRHTKQRLIGEAIAGNKSLAYIKEVVAN